MLKAFSPRNPWGFAERQYGCSKFTGSQMEFTERTPPEPEGVLPLMLSRHLKFPRSRTKPISLLRHLLHLLFAALLSRSGNDSAT